MTNGVSFFTVVARNYLPTAFVLGRSVRRTHPDASFSVFVMDDPDREFDAAIQREGWRAIHPGDIPIEEFGRLAFRYEVIEACTAVKATVMKHLLDRGARKVIFLDPDTFCYRNLSEAITALDSGAIVLTPHRLRPQCADPGTDRLFLAHGAFNLGFVGVSAADEARAFLDWWEARLQTGCVIDVEANLFVDQRWVDLAPAYFPSMAVIRDAGYNMAWWNMDERSVERSPNGWIVNAKDELAFIHFSAMAPDDALAISRYSAGLAAMSGSATPTLESRPDLAALFRDYSGALQAVRRSLRVPKEYRYATYDDGTPISRFERRLYLDLGCPAEFGDPFRSGAGSFREFCRRLPRAAAVRRGKTNPEATAPTIRSRFADAIAGMLVSAVGLRSAERLVRALSTRVRRIRDRTILGLRQHGR